VQVRRGAGWWTQLCVRDTASAACWPGGSFSVENKPTPCTHTQRHTAARFSITNVQAGFKYWLAVSLVFEGTLLCLHFQPALRATNPAFGVVAAALSMSDKVESTFSKFSFQLIGALLGGAIGWAAMWHSALATNPYGLVAVITGFALVVGSLGVTKARVSITLALMTLSTLILVSPWVWVGAAQNPGAAGLCAC
jgi:hypothetical protein